MRRAPPVLWRGGRPPPCRRMKGPCLVWSPRGAPGVRSPRVLLRRRAPGHTVPAVAANMANMANAKPRTPESKGEEEKGTPSSPRRRRARRGLNSRCTLGGNLRETTVPVPVRYRVLYRYSPENEKARSRWRHDSSAVSRSMCPPLVHVWGARRTNEQHSRKQHSTMKKLNC